MGFLSWSLLKELIHQFWKEIKQLFSNVQKHEAAMLPNSPENLMYSQYFFKLQEKSHKLL